MPPPAGQVSRAERAPLGPSPAVGEAGSARREEEALQSPPPGKVSAGPEGVWGGRAGPAERAGVWKAPPPTLRLRRAALRRSPRRRRRRCSSLALRSPRLRLARGSPCRDGFAPVHCRGNEALKGREVHALLVSCSKNHRGAGG